jgi:hypothetical protein
MNLSEFPALDVIQQSDSYTWNSILLLKQRVLNFYFGLSRDNPYESVEKPLSALLFELKSSIRINRQIDGLNNMSETSFHFLRVLYLMIGHTRDIYVGRGERDLAYHMIYVWYQYFPVLAIYAFHQFFHGSDEDMYGSIKDLIYFPDYIRGFSKRGDSFLDICVKRINRQIQADPESILHWIPSESSSKGWLFDLMALDWHGIDFFKNVSLRLMNKMCMNYRKEISSYKRLYSGREINNRYANKGFCKENGVFCKNKDLGKYVKLIACSQKICPASSSSKKNILWINKKWSNILAEYYFFLISPTVPLIDISIEMSDSELYSAIGIACFIAYKSGIHRILLMSHVPIWIVIDNSMDFISNVLKILSECKHRTMCNYASCISLVHSSQIFSNFDVSILLLSNFHFLKRKFRFNELHNIRLVFWNIGSSYQNILPFYDSNILMISGTSLSVVRFMDSLYHSKCDSYDFLCKIMDDRRFQKLSDYFNLFLDSYLK